MDKPGRTGAALKLEWDTPHTIDRIRVYDSPAQDLWLKEGYFEFSDGTIKGFQKFRCLRQKKMLNK